MEYQSILKRIEEQKRDENLSAKLYRYAGLIQAIEFFSQKLNFDQITDAAFDFVNELLTLEKSAIFIKQDDEYVQKKSKGCSDEKVVIENSKTLQDLAMLFGGLVYEEERLLKFFEKAVLDTYNVTIAIPLIIENTLYGFVFISNKTVGDLNSDDYIICEALMKLFNNALENYKRYEEIQKANRELDEKIFNLFAINQSSKALLSELDLGMLHNLSVDVFSELTQSSSTGFILYDEKSERYELKAFKDIYGTKIGVDVSLTLNKKPKIDPNKVIIDVSNEKDILYLNGIFNEGTEPLKVLRARYVVLLVKEGKILGLVALGETVTGSEYKNSMFELIESMASSTYIALSNAKLLEQVNEQKKLIQHKLENLISLNSLMKNINSSAKVEVLMEMTLKTLDISFGVEKGLMALYDKEKDVFTISYALNAETEKKEIKINPNWKKVFEGDTVFEAKESGVTKFIGKSMSKDIGASSGILIVPIYIERVDIEVLGVLIAFKNRKALMNDEETILTIETIANHIAPVIRNLFTIEEQKRFLLPNHIELFKRDLKDEINAAVELSTELQIIRVTDGRDFVFKGNTVVDKLKSSFSKIYPFSYNNIFIINNEVDKDIDKKIKHTTGMKDVKVRTMVLGKDFTNFQEFFKLF